VAEPNYDPENGPTDMHPPANVLAAQKLIRDVYGTLRQNQHIWDHTLFIVTTDEGVGVFDHVKPPPAVDPVVGHEHEYLSQGDGCPYEMSSNPFTRYGTRVPNLLISPWISKGKVVRPEGHDVPGACPYPFDHASIIRTAFDLLVGDNKIHLTERDKVAPSFAHALDLDGPTNQGPESIYVPGFDEKPLPKGKGAHHRCHSVPFLKASCHQQTTESFGASLETDLKTRIMQMFGL